MRERSNSAMPPKTVIIIFPAGVVVSAHGSSRDCISAFFTQNVGNTQKLSCRSRQPIELGDDNDIILAELPEHFFKLRTLFGRARGILFEEERTFKGLDCATPGAHLRSDCTLTVMRQGVVLQTGIGVRVGEHFPKKSIIGIMTLIAWLFYRTFGECPNF